MTKGIIKECIKFLEQFLKTKFGRMLLRRIHVEICREFYEKKIGRIGTLLALIVGKCPQYTSKVDVTWGRSMFVYLFLSRNKSRI